MHMPLGEADARALYNTAAVAQRTGVPATTFRAWERRYGYPKPNRDAGGQRLYSERDIEAIRWLSVQTAHGVTISRAIAMLRSGYTAAERPSPPTGPTPAARSFAAVRADLLHALLDLDVGQPESVLAEAFALFSVEDVCMQVIEPLLVEVGDRWHAGELSVADEHYISSFFRARLFALLNVYLRRDGGPLVFTACAPGEWHEVGILLVSLFLARRGIAVRYLGPNLPVEDLAKAVAQHHPAVVAISAQGDETARNLRGASRLLMVGSPPHPHLAFGGQAFNDDPALRASVEGTYVGPNAMAASGSIAHLLDAAEASSARRRSADHRRG